MKALKIFAIATSILLFTATAQAKFYYNFGLNIGIAALGFGWNNYDDGYEVAVVPYAPVVVTPVYTPLPYSYISYYDYGNSYLWPNVSLSYDSYGGYYGGYYGRYYGGYNSYRSPYYSSWGFSPFNVSLSFGWGNCYPYWGNYYGYYGRRYGYGYGYGGYGYGCNNYYINNYYYDNYPATAKRPTTVRENNIPYQNQREARSSLRNSLVDNGRLNRTERSGSETRLARTERNVSGNTPSGTRGERVSRKNTERSARSESSRSLRSTKRQSRGTVSQRYASSRSLRSEIFSRRNDVSARKLSQTRSNRSPQSRTVSRSRRPTRTLPEIKRNTSRQQRRQPKSRTARSNYSPGTRTSKRSNSRTRNVRASKPAPRRAPAARASRPAQRRHASPRVSRPAPRRAPAARVSRPAIRSHSAPRMSRTAARAPSMSAPRQSGGRMRR